MFQKKNGLFNLIPKSKWSNYSCNESLTRVIKLALNERFSLKSTIDEGYISHKELWDLSETNKIISLTNNCGKLRRDYKSK